MSVIPGEGYQEEANWPLWSDCKIWNTVCQGYNPYWSFCDEIHENQTDAWDDCYDEMDRVCLGSNPCSTPEPEPDCGPNEYLHEGECLPIYQGGPQPPEEREEHDCGPNEVWNATTQTCEPVEMEGPPPGQGWPTFPEFPGWENLIPDLPEFPGWPDIELPEMPEMPEFKFPDIGKALGDFWKDNRVLVIGAAVVAAVAIFRK